MHTIHHRRGHKRYPDTAINEISAGPRRLPLAPPPQRLPGPKSEAKMLSGLPRLTPSTSGRPFPCSDTLSGHSRQRFVTMLCYAPRGTGKRRVGYSNTSKANNSGYASIINYLLLGCVTCTRPRLTAKAAASADLAEGH